jgi:hypothetical protein
VAGSGVCGDEPSGAGSKDLVFLFFFFRMRQLVRTQPRRKSSPQ